MVRSQIAKLDQRAAVRLQQGSVSSKVPGHPSSGLAKSQADKRLRYAVRRVCLTAYLPWCDRKRPLGFTDHAILCRQSLGVLRLTF